MLGPEAIVRVVRWQRLIAAKALLEDQSTSSTISIVQCMSPRQHCATQNEAALIARSPRGSCVAY
jgi:hypothetical protein